MNKKKKIIEVLRNNPRLKPHHEILIKDGKWKIIFPKKIELGKELK